MKILAAGGGSGGHVTPVLTVINQLKQRDPALEVWFVCDRGYARQAGELLAQASLPVRLQTIFAGKLRRYQGQPWYERLVDVRTNFKNLRDVVYLGVGFVQSVRLLRRVRPDVVFTKGGFVCVPVGLAASMLKIPLVIHDSDSTPGLTNRILARRATAIATGAPLSNYNYPADRSKYVGIPVRASLRPAGAEERAELKRQLQLDPALPLVLVTGGGTGAVKLNEIVASQAAAMTKEAQVIHLSGADKLVALPDANQDLARRYHAVEFFGGEIMVWALRAADLVVTRAGATTLLELAAVGAPTIIVPHPRISGGHQVRNAQDYADKQAAVVLAEPDLIERPDLLTATVTNLLHDDAKRQALSEAIHQLAKPNAAAEVADMIISAAKHAVASADQQPQPGKAN